MSASGEERPRRPEDHHTCANDDQGRVGQTLLGAVLSRCEHRGELHVEAELESVCGTGEDGATLGRMAHSVCVSSPRSFPSFDVSRLLFPRVLHSQCSYFPVYSPLCVFLPRQLCWIRLSSPPGSSTRLEDVAAHAGTHRTHRTRRTRQTTTHRKDDADQERREAAQKRHDPPEPRKNDSHQRTQASDYRTSDDPEVLIPRNPGLFRIYRRVGGMRGSSFGCDAEYGLDSEVELSSAESSNPSMASTRAGRLEGYPTHRPGTKTELCQRDDGDHPQREEVERFGIAVFVLHEIAGDLGLVRSPVIPSSAAWTGNEEQTSNVPRQRQCCRSLDTPLLQPRTILLRQSRMPY